ncbi:integrin beta-7 [Chanos chanos]|uniref:Integrin beta n=1 Tax=Chanos chanos TaxID=29144 RepID=A0A6J2VQH2_CHACN|nr:integrin beta-7-like [Chanos chanos]
MKSSQFEGDTLVCQPQPSCAECLRSPGCAWCKQKDFLKKGESNERRCDSPKSLTSRGCGKDHVIDPQADVIVQKNSDLSSSHDNVVQLKPQNLHFKLRVGVPKTFNVSFKRAEGYPIDLYYLMDLSYSMKDDLEKVKNLGQDILEMLRKETQDVRIGFGSFVDKETLPYVSQAPSRRRNPCPTRTDTCQPAFTFQNVQPLTSNAAEFKEKVSKQRISGNLDSPEAGLDAIMQAVVCKTEIGWRNVTKILVYTSDDTFHIAGDGRLAGIYSPNDGRCHLSGAGAYTGIGYDYPSVGHLSSILQKNLMQVIFAVTEKSFPAYQALKPLIPQSAVGMLKDDSSNVVQLIHEAYGNLSSTVVLEQDRQVAGLNIGYSSHCAPGAHSTWQSKGECKDIKANQQVDFTVRLTATACVSETFHIKVQGISESLLVTVETLCECACNDVEEKSEHCGGNGTLSCGVCSCNEDRLGQQCECERQTDTDSTLAMLGSCRQANSSQVCSGQGTCECGKCSCRGAYRGDYCECDDSSCELRDGKLCSGHGRCICGECKCEGKYTGSACECSPHQDKCHSANGNLCHNLGPCRCNRCECPQGMEGNNCSRIVTPCKNIAYQDCVVCTFGGRDCSAVCKSFKTELLDGTPDLECPHKDGFTYHVDFDEDDTILIKYAAVPQTVDKTYVIIGSSVSGIIFIGIAIIIVYKILLELYDLREYRSFLRAQEQTDWKDTHNPLFQGATTTVMNPLHTQDG